MSAAAVTMGPALPADEAALRRLLRETPLAGALSLSFEREPHFQLAAAVEGDRHCTVVGRDANGRVVGLATRSVRDVFVDGRPARLGYLGLLRAAGEGRGRIGALREGFARFAADRRPGELPFDLTSVVADNAPARRLLEAGLPGFPVYRPAGELLTLALAPRGRRPRLAAGLALERGAPGRLGAVAELLHAEGARRQFAPVVTPERLACPVRSRGLAPVDFHLVTRGGLLVGCAALWDQRRFKQVVVRGYSPGLAALRALPRPLAAALGLPRLPPVGEPLAAAFLAHLAVEGEDEAVLDALLDAALADAHERGIDLLLLGLDARHPLTRTARRRPHHAYRSVLYTVHAGRGADAGPTLDGRLLGPEVATL